MNSPRILDVGCGEGHLIKRLALQGYKKVYGIDIADTALESAMKRCKKAHIINMDAQKIHFPDALFDIVICTEVIEHIPNYRQALNEMKRVLGPRGVLILTFPNERIWRFCRLLIGRWPLRVRDHIHSLNPALISRQLKMKPCSKQGLPLNTPFFLSPCYLMIFQKE